MSRPLKLNIVMIESNMTTSMSRAFIENPKALFPNNKVATATVNATIRIYKIPTFSFVRSSRISPGTRAYTVLATTLTAVK